MANTGPLSAASARKVKPNTFRVGLLANNEGTPVAVAMHLTFADPAEQGLIVLIGTSALPTIIEQLSDVAAALAAPRTGETDPSTMGEPNDA